MYENILNAETRCNINLSENQVKDLAELRLRRDALQSKISDKDAKDMIDLVNFMSSQKLRILD